MTTLQAAKKGGKDNCWAWSLEPPVKDRILPSRKDCGMQGTFFWIRRARARKPGILARCSCTTALLAVFLLGGGATRASAQTLRWKLKPGDVLHYTLDTKQAANFKVMGRDKKSSRTHTINLSWTVKSVSATGDAEIALKFDRIRMRIEQPPFVPLQFDSSPNNIEIPPEFESTERQIKALADAEFSFELKPSGAVDHLKIPDQTLKNLRDGAGPDAGGQGGISEQGLKDMLLQSSPPSFPSESLEPGKNWANKPSRIAAQGLGTLVVDQVYSFQGPDPKDPKLLLIGMEARVALEPAQDVTAKIRAQEGKGNITFDSDSGRIVSSRVNQKMEMVISDRGQDLVQTTETTSTMMLDR
jgi:hypothetical protein